MFRSSTEERLHFLGPYALIQGVVVLIDDVSDIGTDLLLILISKDVDVGLVRDHLLGIFAARSDLFVSKTSEGFNEATFIALIAHGYLRRGILPVHEVNG